MSTPKGSHQRGSSDSRRCMSSRAEAGHNSSSNAFIEKKLPMIIATGEAQTATTASD